MTPVDGKRSGAWLVRYALEQLPVSHTFGIPGVHNTETYDELGESKKILPVLVTHEGGAAFAADAMSRTSGGRIGCLVIVPAAGVTHALSGIAEAYLAGVPLLVIAGGIRIGERFTFQIHNVDQQRLVETVVKRTWKVRAQFEVAPAIFEAYRVATSGVPGPVLVEIPADVQMFRGDVGKLPTFEESPTSKSGSSGEPPSSVAPGSWNDELDRAVELLVAARAPAIFVGWGAVDVSGAVAEIAERLGAPVATTLQGLSAFPGNHPLHVGMGFGPAAVPAAENAFRACDCLLAIGTRFAEIPTGSFSCRVPENLIHIDLAEEAIGRNFPAKIAIVGDARVRVPQLLDKLRSRVHGSNTRATQVAAQVAADKQAYREEWVAVRSERVNPALFFAELRRQLPDDGIVTVDDGHHTFLAAELFEVRRPRTFLSPVDFNCMGYAVPAALGAKLANPERPVVSVVGDGAFLMTGMETLTAATLKLGIAYFVFHDQELSQIAQGQQLMYNRKTCSRLADLRLAAMAEAVGARYVEIACDGAIETGIREALAVQQQPVLVDVRVDYSKRTRFTQGVARARLNRFPAAERLRFLGRAAWRRITG